MTLEELIDAYVNSLNIESWAPLTANERDLLRRTLGRVELPKTSAIPADAA